MAIDRNHISTPMKVVIVIFCVVLVVMLMLPSLSAIIGNKQQEQPQETDTSQQVQTADDIDKTFQVSVDSINDRLKSDPENIALLTSLGDAYFDWGMALLNAPVVIGSDSDADKAQDAAAKQSAHAQEVFGHAIEAYDNVLAKGPSNAVTVDKAIAQFYSGATTDAIANLEAFVETEQTYSPAFANLGMFYEMTGDKDKARSNYQRALDTDKDDAHHVKGFVERRLAELDKAAEQPQDANANADSATESPASPSSEPAPKAE